MVVEWLAPALTAYRHRDDVRSLLEGGMAWLFGKKTTLAFTGMEGVGKTVLLDHLTGAAFQEGYTLPLRSQREERGRITTAGKRLVATVVPGQVATPRRLTLDKLFGGKRLIDGVVHVVCNGLASVREPNVTTDLIRRRKLTTVTKYRKYALGQELLDLDSTCHAIRESQRKKRTPGWLIVAVDKVDLYFDTIERARDYYSPTSDSPFADRLRALATQVGTDFFAGRRLRSAGAWSGSSGIGRSWCRKSTRPGETRTWVNSSVSWRVTPRETGGECHA
jgi:hypothetical protein